MGARSAGRLHGKSLGALLQFRVKAPPPTGPAAVRAPSPAMAPTQARDAGVAGLQAMEQGGEGVADFETAVWPAQQLSGSPLRGAPERGATLKRGPSRRTLAIGAGLACEGLGCLASYRGGQGAVADGGGGQLGELNSGVNSCCVNGCACLGPCQANLVLQHELPPHSVTPFRPTR